MKIATLNRGKETKYLNEYPLVDEEDIYAHDHLKEGDLFYLMNDRDQYIATAYVGRQHKGVGWVLSYDKDEVINTQFLKHYLKMPKLNVNISIILMGRMLFVFLMVKAMV